MIQNKREFPTLQRGEEVELQSKNERQGIEKKQRHLKVRSITAVSKTLQPEAFLFDFIKMRQYKVALSALGINTSFNTPCPRYQYKFQYTHSVPEPLAIKYGFNN